MRGRFGSFTLASAAALVVAVTANVPAATAQLFGPIVPVAVDMASAAGIAQTQISFDAVVQDFNGDALPDFLIGHHGTAAMQMFVNDGDGTFTEPNPNMFDRPDRHDCASADVNQDGRPDIACAIGADHGVGVKRNQLWIQNAGPPLGFTDSGVADGIADPFGRGRAPLLFDANNDGLPDLFIQSEPGRPDGYPSPNRFYVNGGAGVFHDAPAFGLDIDLPARTLGTGCVQAADVNNDGFQDVMLCAQDHLHIFLNQGGTHFVDASASLGVAGDSPNDATLQDVNGDGVPDLLEVTKGTFVVRPQQQGVFQPAAFSYPLTSGVAVAAGDANADGKPDVYLVQAGSVSGNVADVMLLNASSGSTVSFVSMTIPQVSTGIGQSAFPIDYDGNGLTDFLVLNGQNQPGPLELIAFFPTTGGPAARSANPSSPSSSAALPRVPGAPQGGAGGAARSSSCGPSFTTATFGVGGSGTPRITGFSGSPTSGLAVGTVSGNAPIADRWDGAAWTTLSVPTLAGAESGLNSVASIAPSDAWSVGYQTVGGDYATAALHWDGSAWTVVSTSNPGADDNSLIALAAVSSTDVWATGYQLNGGIGTPLAEHWDGTSWGVVAMASGAWDRSKITGLVALGSHNVWAVGWSSTAGVYSALLEHWDGTAWSIAAGPSISGVDSSLLTAVAADRAGGAWAVGYTATGSLDQTLIERFDGTQWTVVPSPDPGVHADLLRAVASVSTGDAWAGGMTLDDSGAYVPLLEHWDGQTWNVFAGASLGQGDHPIQAVDPLSQSNVWAGGEGSKMEQLCPVSVRDAGFSPATATGAMGQSVLWQVPATDTTSHTVTDGTGLGLFDSGPLAPGTSFQATYVGAGAYTVSDTLGGHTSTVNVPMTVSPTSGPVGTSFTIVWAAGTAPAGLTYDVRIQMPGSTQWTSFYQGTDPSAPYVPTLTGTYTFHARIGNVPLAVYSSFSPKVKITVT